MSRHCLAHGLCPVLTVSAPALAPTAGHAELAFTARAQGASDAVAVKREVQVPLSLEAVALQLDTTAFASFGLAPWPARPLAVSFSHAMPRSAEAIG